MEKKYVSLKLGVSQHIRSTHCHNVDIIHEWELTRRGAEVEGLKYLSGMMFTVNLNEILRYLRTSHTYRPVMDKKLLYFLVI